MTSSLALRRLFLTTSFLALAAPALAHADDAPGKPDKAPAEITVIGKRVIKGSAGATGLDLSLRQTPQSVTVVGFCDAYNRKATASMVTPWPRCIVVYRPCGAISP